LLRGVAPHVVYRGDVHSDYVGLEDPHLFGLKGESASLADGHVYLLLLRPSTHSKALLRTPRGSRYHGDALPSEEVLAVVEQ
jgi:hypothetical protein